MPSYSSPGRLSPGRLCSGALLRRLRPPFSFSHQLRQLGDIDSDAPRFVAGEYFRSGAAAGLLFITDAAERLPVIVADDEARAVVFDVPGRPESALCHYLPVHSRAASNITNATGMTRPNAKRKKWVIAAIGTLAVGVSQPTICAMVAERGRIRTSDTVACVSRRSAVP